VVNFLEGAILANKRSVGRTGLQYLKQVARNRAAASCTAMGRAVCNNSKWKAAKQSEDGGIRRISLSFTT
jgi:hypothetical protein